MLELFDYSPSFPLISLAFWGEYPYSIIFEADGAPYGILLTLKDLVCFEGLKDLCF
jgi:hypothetical protein